ncbi:MAG: ATP-binding cassette domain-containing protein, partial [Deltaproteobacteria bacterium]|nr:ATP-binding cassette domain-containing protein [Deltaproteobacteria bacterium]
KVKAPAPLFSPPPKGPPLTEEEKAVLWRRLASVMRPMVPTLALAICCMALAAASTAGMAYLIKPLLDKVFFESDPALLLPLTLLTAVIYSATGVFSFLQAWLMNKVGYTIVNDLRVRLFSSIEEQSMDYFDTHPSGELISRVVNDVTLIQTSVTHVVTGLVMDVCKVIGLVAILIIQDPFLALLGLLGLPLAVYPIVRFGKRLRRLATDSQIIMGGLIVVLTETFQGVRVVQSHDMTEFEIRRFAGECRRNVDNLMRSVTIKNLSSAVMDVLGGVCLSAVIFYGGHSVVMGESTPGTFFSFMTALLLLYEPMKRLARIHNESQQGLSAAARIFETLDRPPKVVSPPGGVKIARAKGLIEFCDVSFNYTAERPALKEINLAIHPGERLALVGRSGAGKTTMANLVSRFYDPDQGSVKLDGIDLRTMDLASLRAQVALVGQEVTLFEASVRHNIAYGRLDAPLKDVEAAAEAAKADGFISALPKGYDESVGERGLRLSGGQRQRLAIARAILKDSPILILDEATSALDSESEKHVQAALENLMRGRTTLVIAHRLSTIVKADRAAVLKDGRLVELGTHDELMNLGGEYYRLQSLQSGALD